MMRSQEVGRRYLAGFVMAAAAAYAVVVCITSALAWPETYHWWLVANLFGFGLAPALAAFLLGLRAWSTKTTRSAGFAAIGLIILILAVAIWRTFVISF